MTTDQQKIQVLEARIKKIEWEKDILKKATALLMSENIVNSFLAVPDKTKHESQG